MLKLQRKKVISGLSRHEPKPTEIPKGKHRKVATRYNKLNLAIRPIRFLQKQFPSSAIVYATRKRSVVNFGRKKKSTDLRNTNRYFVSHAKKLRYNARVLSAYAKRLEKRLALTLFNDRRPAL